MSVDAVYKGQRVYRVEEADTYTGPFPDYLLDFGVGEPLTVPAGDLDLTIDPSDDEWDAAVDLRDEAREE